MENMDKEVLKVVLKSLVDYMIELGYDREVDISFLPAPVYQIQKVLEDDLRYECVGCDLSYKFHDGSYFYYHEVMPDGNYGKKTFELVCDASSRSIYLINTCKEEEDVEW